MQTSQQRVWIFQIEICHRFNHNTDACWKNRKGEGGNSANKDALDGLEEGKPTVDGKEGMA